MFDTGVFDDLQRSVAAVNDAPVRLADSQQKRDALRTVQQMQDALDVAKASLLEAVHDDCSFEDDGASSLSAWARTELRMSPAEARSHVAASATFDTLKDVRVAAGAGRIRHDHVKQFTYGLRHVGISQVREAEDWLLDVAKTCAPDELHQVLRSLREAVYPETLDRQWAKGMDKADISLNQVPDGWHLSGFLPITTGCKFNEVLRSMSAPITAEDKRSGSERRIDAIDQLMQSQLAHGLRTDKGIRPQLNVTLDSATFDAHLGDRSDEPVVPATLDGFGSIGSQLLAAITCDSEISGIFTHGYTGGPIPQLKVVDVGRKHRTATPRQRQAVRVRQNGQCAAPGCVNTFLEMHHPIWWSRGGATKLDNLIGLCTRCHHLVHRGLLIVRADGDGGFNLYDRTGRPRHSDRAQLRFKTEQRVRAHIQRRRTRTKQPVTPEQPVTSEQAPSPLERSFAIDIAHYVARTRLSHPPPDQSMQ